LILIGKVLASLPLQPRWCLAPYAIQSSSLILRLTSPKANCARYAYAHWWLVKPGSIERGDNLQVRFAVTTARLTSPCTINVSARLVSGRAGVVAEGKLEPGGFRRRDGAAKHDERYMPREVVDALKKSGRWQEGEGKSPGSNPR
jgi:hypothetical protein